MSTVLNNISKDNTRFTIFENDQVLTADQLNDLFNYLDIQSRLTRTRAIGVGIICGLEIGALGNKNIVVSKGAAITTDGDLLHIDEAVEFDQFELFEDVNARYPYFRTANDQMIPVFELKASRTGSETADDMSTFEEAAGAELKEFAGILYLEDYNNDPDVCTGTDCDNKGITAAKELKVLLVHKNNMRGLLSSMPGLNKNYFALEDLSVPRVSVKNTIDTYAELNAAFNAVLSVREDIKGRLSKAYEVCKLIVEDEFPNGDPAPNWSSLLDQHFSVSTSIYAQYVYDFARDLSFAYTEMRETLFGDNMICCPDVNLFPKHVLLGLVKTAAKAPVPDIPVTSPLSPPIFVRPIAPRFTGISIFKPRFDIGLLKRRFHTVHIDTEYRHLFYESPVLNNKEENILMTRFCFTRIDSLIRNFKVPTAEELQNVDQNLRITPGYSEARPLGERSIPFYYRFSADLPVNLYWNYNANVRRKENDILSYSASQYSNRPSTITPLLFNILPYDFFRVEGHIGFRYQEAERALNRLVQENNLPFNVMTVQVERNPRTIPRRDWYFSEIDLYSGILRNNFFDQMNQVDLVHNQLKSQTADLPEAVNINTAIDSFTNAKNKILTNAPVNKPQFDINVFKADVQNVISASTDVKVQTKKFDFAQTAIPHDFVINSNVAINADLIADLILQKETRKIEELMLGNFMKINPGLEHAGGVLRGGTFVLVYTSNDDKVVADFMLPYYVADKDIVPNPPVVKPLPPLPAPPKIDLSKIFKKVPLYYNDLESKINEKILPLDQKFESKINEKFSGFETKFNEFNQKEAALTTKFTLYDTILLGKVTTPVKTTPDIGGVRTGLEGGVISPGGPDVNIPGSPGAPAIPGVIGVPAVPGGIGGVIIGNRDITVKVTEFKDRQDELEALDPKAPERKEKETALLKAAESLTKELSLPDIAGDRQNEMLVKSLLSDVHSGTSLISNKDLAGKAAKVIKLANKINKGFRSNK
jgi:hypothetical protein